MQSALKIVVSLVLLSSASASYRPPTAPRSDIANFVDNLDLIESSLTNPMDSSTKLRRDGVLNLYPFPRVGRATPHTWQIPINDYYLEYEPVEKRQLYAFPRVGRPDLSILRGPVHREFQPVPVKRTTADNPGMWFGPRLGRSFKSDDEDISVQNENASEPEQVEERKKRNTEAN